MEEEGLASGNHTFTKKAVVISDSSTKLATLTSVQPGINGIRDVKANMFDRTDIDNHNINVDNAVSIDSEESGDIVGQRSICPSNVTFDGLSCHNELVKIVNDSPKVTPGKSRYGRVRKPKLSADFVSVDKKSFSVLNSSSYECVFAENSVPIPAPKKKKLYLRKSEISSINGLSSPICNENKKSKQQIPHFAVGRKTEELKTDASILNSDVCELDETSISSMNSSVIKTYSRKSEISFGSDDKYSGTEDDTSRDTIHGNFTELNWKVGDVAWAKIGCYPYWPSIVTLEYGSSIYVKSVGKRGSRLAVHVQFFGDRGRRSWVLTTSLIKYESKEQFLELKRQYSKDKLRLKYFNIIRMKELWEKAITEADTILKLPHEERIQYYQSIYPISEDTHAAEMFMNKIKRTTIRRRRKNPEERRGRKRKIIDCHENHGFIKKKRKSQLTMASISANDTSDSRIKTVRTSKKSRKSMDEHLRRRRAFEKRLNKIMNQSTTLKALNARRRVKNGLKLRDTKNVKFDKFLEGERRIESEIAKISEKSSSTKPEKENALSVYDFESDEETDIFIGTYNSRYTPNILAKVEEEKNNKNENTSTANNTKINSVIRELVNDKAILSGKLVKDDTDGDSGKNENAVETNALIIPKRGRGRPKGSKNVKTLLKLEKMKNKGCSIRNRVQERLGARKKKIILNSERKIPSKNQLQEASDNNDSNLELKKKVHPKKRLLEKSRRTEKCTLPDHVESNINEKDKKDSNENEKSRKPSPCILSKEDLESDDDDLKIISPDMEEEKLRSSSPQAIPSLKSKKSSSIFGGFKFEKVCLICEKPGDTVRCGGPCSGTYHTECVQMQRIDANTTENVNLSKPRGRGRWLRKSSSNLVTEIETSDVESFVENFASVAMQSATEANQIGREALIAQECQANLKNFVTNAVENVGGTKCSIIADDQFSFKNDINIVHKSTMSVPNLNNAKLNDTNKCADSPPFVSEFTNSVIETVKSKELPTTLNGYCKLAASNKEDVNGQEECKHVAVAEKVAANNYSDNINEISEKEKKQEIGKIERTESPLCTVENEETASSDTFSENLNYLSKNDNANGVDFRCFNCSENKLYPCFTCGKDVEEKTGETERYACCMASCGRVYHEECLKAWPQATWSGSNTSKLIRNGTVASKETLMCPQHYCHTCISENPAVQKNKHNNKILTRCIRCPTTYHKRVHCLPAGTEILTMSQIICPRHYEPPPGVKNTVHLNTSWCFICCIGGSLICCEECPTSFHAECLRLRPEEYEGRYICDDCQAGRYLLYGEIAWVKLGRYRWWPAKILYPNEVPENIQNLPHRRGEFVVQFYGSHDYNWVNRGRAFLYQEGDSGKKTCRRSGIDMSFEKALQEAEEAYEKLKVDKAARDEEAKLGLKPPRYVHIKANKPVGNVRIVELNTSNITACECDPHAERPCAPDSDCINRMLLVECNPLICPAGERCLNQAFEKQQYPPLVPYKTDKRGWGLKTLIELKKGDFIIEYVGEMIDEEEYKRRVKIMHKNQEDNYYFLTIDKDRMLDAGPKGNVSRFMNHSCDPNCETQKWTVNGDTRVGLFALKDISSDTELVFNYNLATQGNEMKPCFCGSDKCSGFIGVKAIKNGNSSVEETRKRSNEENENEPRKKRFRRRRKKIIRTRPVRTEKNTVLDKTLKKDRFKSKMPKESCRSSWRVDARFKNKAQKHLGVKKNVESLRKHREMLKQRTISKSKKLTIKAKGERCVRKKMPKDEKEKQAVLFKMMKKRIQRKIEEMTMCKLEEKCFVCGKPPVDSELLFCDNNKCPKGYHLRCVNLMKWPSGRWLCPWHYCTVCKSIRKVSKCDECTNSYCYLHASEHLLQENGSRYLCSSHQSSSVSSLSNFNKELVVEMSDVAAQKRKIVGKKLRRTKKMKSNFLKPVDKSHVVVPKTKKTCTKKIKTKTKVNLSGKKLEIHKNKSTKNKRNVGDRHSSFSKNPKVVSKKVAKKVEKTKLQSGAMGKAPKTLTSRHEKVIVEANVNFNFKSSSNSNSNTDILSRMNGCKAKNHDSDESFSSAVTSELITVIELPDIGSKECSESDNAAAMDENIITEDVEISDGEYDNVEVEVINAEDSDS